MSRVFTRYLLFLSFLLLTAIGQSSASARSGSSSCVSRQEQFGNGDALSPCHHPVCQSQFVSKKEHVRIDLSAIEAEEDEQDLFQTYLENFNHLYPLAWAFLFALLLTLRSWRFLSYKQFFQLSSYRSHIRLQIFRI